MAGIKQHKAGHDVEGTGARRPEHAKAGAVAPAFSPGFARAPMVRPAVHAPTHVPASIIRGPVGAPRQVPPPPRITGSMGVRAVGLRRAGDTLRAPRHALRPFGLGL